MRIPRAFRFFLPVLLLLAAPPHAEDARNPGNPKRAAEWIDIARLDVSEGRHAEALVALDSALALSPRDFDARLLRAKILSWQGRFAPAERALNELLAESPADADARLALAYLRYYQGHLDQAEAGFQALLAANPRNADAAAGLSAVEKAARARKAALAPRPRWRVDAGGEYSVFTRREQPDWNQQYAQLSRRLDDGTTVHGRLERHSQFELTDFAVEAGAYREFLPRLRGSFAGGWTLDPDFRPDWRLAADAEWLALPKGPSGSRAIPAVWALAGARYDVYEAAEFLGLQPGLRLEWSVPRGLSGLTARLARVAEVGEDAVTGWSARADGATGTPRVGPVRENARVWLGVADAPETLAAAGVVQTVSTFTFFTGAAVDFSGGWTLNMGYARDDREGSWIRHVYNAGITRNF